jgi:hypothetical protein
MKKILFAAAIFVTMNAFANPTAVNEKVLHAFNQVFKNAQSVVWQESNGQYEVKFKQDGISVRVLYDKKGTMLESLRYYNEEHLPMLLRAKLEKQFSGKKVFGVTEYTSNNEVVYHITLEDENNWTMVRANSYAEIQVDKKFKKA